MTFICIQMKSKSRINFVVCLQIQLPMNSFKPFSTFQTTILFLSSIWLLLSCTQDNKSIIDKQIDTESKIKNKGAHVFGMHREVDFQSIRDMNIDWLTFVSWGYQDDFDSPILTHHNGDSIMIRESDSSYVEHINLMRSEGFKVLVKPHVWVRQPSEGTWRSEIYPTDDENWEVWKENYTDYILRYARIAEETHAEMFCIGAELTELTLGKPNYWKDLIVEIKKVYQGKLTYAANWYKEYEKIKFWDQLDYIGIQAYFPLVDHQNPSVDELNLAWDQYIPVMDSVAKLNKKKILFTEMGYKSTATSAIKPWEWPEHLDKEEHPFSSETQANCYQAFFNSIWNKKWFAGCYLWQMRSDVDYSKHEESRDFSPQGKPAQSIISEGFSDQ